MMLKVLGTKKLMTQVFTDEGMVVPVTVLGLSDLFIAKKFDSLVLVGYGKKKNPTKDEVGSYKDLKFVPLKVIEVKSDKLLSMNVGDKITLDVFDGIDKVDITAVTKGKGFAGVVKRWGFHGGSRTHGQSDRMRAPGSIGAGTDPGNIVKGKRMGGRMGGIVKTVKNLKVIKLDKENSYVLVKGAVPGNNNSILEISIK